MEDNIQTILIFLISIIILFIFPVYIAYEKKDDISYVLALSYTQSFVEEVRNKGYITYDDYASYVGMISSAGNIFDVKMEHKHKAVYPTTSGYSVKTEIYNTKYILNIIKGGINKYYMNTDDVFSITIKNRNTTLATVIFNLVTINSQDMNTRIYVNYAGQINDEKWYNDDVSYLVSDLEISGKMLHLKDYYHYSELSARTREIYVDDIKDSFTIELKTDPTSSDTTSIADLGSTVSSSDIPKGLFLKNESSINNKLILYLGENGIMVLLQDVFADYEVVLMYANKITGADIIKIAVKEESGSTSLALFVNDERVCFNNVSNTGITTEGAKIVDNIKYKGIINYFNIYKTS